MGGTAWFLLLRYAPKYTAQTYIKVLPPIEKDPMKLGGVQVNKDLQYGHRLSMASIIKQQSTFEKLIGLDKIQETQWFKQFGENTDKRITKALKELKRNRDKLNQKLELVEEEVQKEEHFLEKRKEKDLKKLEKERQKKMAERRALRKAAKKKIEKKTSTKKKPKLKKVKKKVKTIKKKTKKKPAKKTKKKK